MARRYRFENLRSNLYLVGVAPSASGKEVPLSAVARILGDAGLAKTLAGGEPKSGSAVLSRLVEHPVAVYTLDEFGMLLRALTLNHPLIFPIVKSMPSCSMGNRLLPP